MTVDGRVKSFRDLAVWQRGIELSIAVYEMTRSFPREELYGLRSQLQRAGVSVPSNIAEGYGRRSTGEMIQFMGHTRGSNYEVQTQLVIARKLGYADDVRLAKCEDLSSQVEKMLNSYIAAVTDRSDN